MALPFADRTEAGVLLAGRLRSYADAAVNPDVVALARVDEAAIENAARTQMQEIARREARYREGAPAPVVRGRTAILVDDGLATGSTMTVAVHAVRREQPRRIVVAVPVGARESCDALAAQVDEMICLHTPEPFRAVSLWYETFDQTSDDDVVALLRRARERHAAFDPR